MIVSSNYSDIWEGCVCLFMVSKLAFKFGLLFLPKISQYCTSVCVCVCVCVVGTVHGANCHVRGHI